MPRYIDADALLEKAWDADTRIGYVQVVDVGDVIDAPTISPDEVRGAGKWIDNGVRAWSCSCCGTPLNHIRQFASFEKNELPNYCPSCGARLTGGEND